MKIGGFGHAPESILLPPFGFGSPFPRPKKVTWLKPHARNYGKLGAESSSCKTQLTRQPFLFTCELSGQAQLPLNLLTSPRHALKVLIRLPTGKGNPR